MENALYQITTNSGESADSHEAASSVCLLQADALHTVFPKRDRHAHKGDFGHVLIIGGDQGMSGAVQIAAEAALRVGAGLVSVATRVMSHIPARPEVMCHVVHSTAELMPLLQKATVIVLGPGLGKSEWSRGLFSAVREAVQPVVMDADALNLLSESPRKNTNWILTPHLGEAGRLLHCTALAVQADRLAAAKKIVSDYDGVVVLKGAGTLIHHASDLPFMCTAGNPGMASGGMGDALSGVIGGLLAQHFSLWDAAKIGVLIHAMAGDAVANTMGERGMLASDLMPELRRLVNNLV